MTTKTIHVCNICNRNLIPESWFAQYVFEHKKDDTDAHLCSQCVKVIIEQEQDKLRAWEVYCRKCSITAGIYQGWSDWYDKRNNHGR